MFDLGWSEMMLVGLLALIIIGPKDLPKLFRQLSSWMKQLHRMTNEFQAGVHEIVRDADIEDAKKMLKMEDTFIDPKHQREKFTEESAITEPGGSPEKQGDGTMRREDSYEDSYEVPEESKALSETRPAARFSANNQETKAQSDNRISSDFSINMARQEQASRDNSK